MLINFLSSQNFVQNTYDIKFDVTEIQDFRLLTFIDGKTMYLVTRGTDNPENWAKNLDSDITQMKGLNVSQGFHTHFMLGKPLIEQAWKKFSACDKVVFAGHSLGGAVAQLAYVYYYKPGTQFDCITAGCPRVGCQDFSAKFNEICRASKVTRFARFVRRDREIDDIVPSLPNPITSTLGGFFNMFKSHDYEGQERDTTFGSLARNIVTSVVTYRFEHAINRQYIEKINGMVSVKDCVM